LDEHKVPPKAIFEFQHDEQTYFGWIGHATPRKRIFRRTRMRITGPDVYVFNQEGILVDFTGDIEDNPQFKLQWMQLWVHHITNAESMSAEDLRQRFIDLVMPVP